MDVAVRYNKERSGSYQKQITNIKKKNPMKVILSNSGPNYLYKVTVFNK